jgi:hypothetical protein
VLVRGLVAIKLGGVDGEGAILPALCGELARMDRLGSS